MAKPFKATIEDFEADDIRAFYDTDVFRVWHLVGKERTFKIARVQRITKNDRGEVTKRAILRMSDSKGRDVPLPLELNPTNRKVISGLYGLNPKAWIGRTITLYPTTCDSPQGVTDCLRVRPYVPGSRGEVRTNKQGATVLPTNTERLPVVVSAAAADDDDDDAVDVAGAMDDDEEPPTGALETDRAANPFEGS